MEERLIRHIIYSDEFEEYYASMNEQLKKKYDYALQIVKSQYVVSSKIVKSLEKTDFYELRISISSNEYRTILLAVDHDNFIQSNTRQKSKKPKTLLNVIWRIEYVET